MRVYASYDTDPTSMLFDFLAFLIISTVDGKETEKVLSMVDGLSSAQMAGPVRDCPHTLVFVGQDFMSGMLLESIKERDCFDFMLVARNSPGIPTEYTFKIDGVEYAMMTEMDEYEFLSRGIDRDLRAGTAKLAAGTSEPKCKHVPGATPVFGRTICKKCGNDLS